VPHGDQLNAFVEAVVGGGDVSRSRRAVRAAVGDAGFVDTCATLASFSAVVKIADGTGIPIEDWKAERSADLRQALDIDRFRQAE
jgi:hypothetical protein